MEDPNYLENLKRMNFVQEALYDQAYTAYLNNDNATVHQAYMEMMKTYPLSKIMPKFMFIDALAYVTERNPEKFKSTIKEMLERYPETDITPTASAFVKQLNQGRKINGGSSNARGMLWSIRLSNDSTASGEGKEFTPFKEGKNKPQLFVLVFSTDSVSPNQLLYEVAKHNFNSFLMRDFDLEQMTFGNLGLIVVKGFPNYHEVEIYRDKWEKDEEKVVPSQAHYVIISDENFNLLLSEGRTFEEYFRYLDELNEEKIEGQIPEDAFDDDKKDEGGEDDIATDDDDEKKPTKSVKKGQGKADKKTDDKEEEKKEEKPKVDTPEQQGNPALLEEARRRAEQRQLEEQRKEEEKRKAEEAKKREEELKRQQEREREAERLRAEDEAKRQQELEKQGKTSDGSSTSADDKDDVRHLKKQKDEETKAREKAEKDAKKAEKERQKQLEREEKAREDSIKKAEKEREKELRAAEKAKEDSIKALEKEREELQKQKEREKEEAKKAAEKERKDKQKAKEEARKQKEKERKERQKERERKKKEEQKRKKEEAKARKEAAKQRQKEREEQRKQRERERKEAEKNKN